MRWQVQLATSKTNVMNARAALVTASMALARVLHQPMERGFSTIDVTLDDPDLLTSRPHVLDFLNDRSSFNSLSDVLVDEGKRNSPELEELTAQTAAQERLLESRRAAFTSPTVSAFGEISNTFLRAGTNSGAARPFDATDWSAGVQVSLPLFTGFSRQAEVRQASAELSQLRLVQQSTEESIEFGIRSRLEDVQASYFAIDQSRRALDASERGFALVADAYAQGSVPILNLLDAQDATLRARQAEVSATSNFLIAYMKAQRAVGQFDLLQSAEDRDARAQLLAERWRRLRD